MATYIDFKINESGDVVVENGEFVFVEDQEVLRQQAKINLQLSKQDWFLDFSEGITYFDDDDGILGARIITPLMETELQEAVLRVEGIEVINSFEYDFTDNELNVTIQALTVFGELSIDQLLQVA